MVLLRLNNSHINFVVCILNGSNGHYQSLQTLELDVHRRKWTLTIPGLKGDADEHEDDTRDACIDLAKTHLDVKDAKASDLAACHRLGKKAGSGIIVRFPDLRQRNQWLMGAKNLRNHMDNISLIPDLPPVLRPLKTELLNIRRDMPPDRKSRSSLRYLKQWPYIELVCGQSRPIQPTITIEAIAKEVIGTDPFLKLIEPTET